MNTLQTLVPNGRESVPTRYRLLIVDDNPAIHTDFRKILSGPAGDSTGLDDVESTLFGDTAPLAPTTTFEIESAYQGQEGLAKVQLALHEKRPYSLAFVDVRMPPGWDGIETIVRMWQEDPTLQIVICTAYSDYSWDEMRARLGESDNAVILKKPFDNIEAVQLAHALTKKWVLTHEVRQRIAFLEQAGPAGGRSDQGGTDGQGSRSGSGDLFSLAFRSNPLPMATFALATQRFTEVNESLLRLSGSESAKVVGQTPAECGLFEDPASLAVTAIAGRAGGSAELAMTIRSRTGTRHPVRVKAEFTTWNGEPMALLFFLPADLSATFGPQRSM